MKGSRALTRPEIDAVLTKLSSSRTGLRDRALFVLGFRAGFRISEILSLKLCDVVQNGNLVDRIYVARKNMKKKTEGRSVALHPEARAALSVWVKAISLKQCDPDTFLFRSRQGGNKPIGRQNAWNILNAAYKACGLTGKLGTHAMRKSFAAAVYHNLGKDLLKTQKAMGHRSITSTVSYLSFAEEDIEDAILKP